MIKKRIAFTLIELLIVVMIVVILATIGIPGYYKAKRKAIQKEGISSLKLIAAAERIYRLERDSYFYYPNSGTVSALDDINNNLKLFLNPTNWTYSITNNAGVITAQAVSGACTYTITSGNLDAEPTGAGCY